MREWPKTNRIGFPIKAMQTVLLPAMAICCGGILGVEMVVEVDEILTRERPSNNGATPLWCFGAPLIFRNGDEVFISVRETGPNVPKKRTAACNSRWRLWHRKGKGKWSVVSKAEEFDQREPCPLGGTAMGDLFLSVNPLIDRKQLHGACRPQILRFTLASPAKPPAKLNPAWAGKPLFTEHSYRGMAVDGKKGELLLLNIHGTSDGGYHSSFRDSEGKWHPQSIFSFPIRACYPQIILSSRAAHVLAIGDIKETNKAWKALKYEKFKWTWDYVFRRLFYTFTPDVQKKPFAKPVEVDSVESTCGQIRNMDLLADGKGQIHALYTKKSHQFDFIRDRFFPGKPITHALVHAIIKDGKVAQRQILFESVDDEGKTPVYGRFHLTPDGRLVVVVCASWREKNKGVQEGNFLMEITSKGTPTPLQPIALKHPLVLYFTNTPRGGSKPSFTVDLFGVDRVNASMGTRMDSVTAKDYALRYVRLKLR